MAQVACVRCGQTREALARAPWPGEEGREIQQKVCASCWGEWRLMEVKVINEYRLNLALPEHAEALEKQMRLFLGLATEASGLGAAPYGFGEGGPEGKGDPR